MNKCTIADLSEGRVAVLNDSNVEQLKKVLNTAFPKDNHSVDFFFLENALLLHHIVLY